jgi:hypothetical protein
MHSNTRNPARPGFPSVIIAAAVAIGSVFPASAQSSTDPIRTIVPVTMDTDGSITVGSTKYPGGAFQIVLVRRQPNRTALDSPTVLFHDSLTSASDVNSKLLALKTQYPDAMLLINSQGWATPFPISSIANTLVQNFGAGTEIQGAAGISFVFVGIAGQAQGAYSLQRAGVTHPVSAYLAPDSNGNYAFLRTDFIRYDLQLNGDITIGKTTYTVAGSNRPGCNGQNAFHLVVVDAIDPSKLLTNNSYCTASSDAQIAQMLADMSGIRSEGVLVFVASNGKPIPNNWNYQTNGDPRLYDLARYMGGLGGYFETFSYLSPNDTYSLVGAVRPPAGVPGARKRGRESSSVYPEISAGVRPSGELHGILARQARGDWYRPLNADGSGYANLGLYEVLATPSAPFPHPVGTAEIAAFQYINNNLCGPTTCNIRDLYDDLNISISNYLVQLQAMKDANNTDCSVAGNAGVPFCVVRQQLLTELEYVNDIRLLFNNIQSLWLGSGSTTILSLLNAYSTIQAQLQPPPNASSQSLTDPLVNFFLSLGSFIPEVGPLFGLADVGFNLGTSLTTDQQGNKTIDLTSTIANLEAQAISQFTAQQNTTGTLFEIIYQDWGKLSALGAALTTQQSASSPWYWSSSATGLMLNQLSVGIRRASYENIMAAAYAIGSYLPNSPSVLSNGWGWGLYPLLVQPYGYRVAVNRESPSIPLSSPFYQPNYIPYTFPNDPGNGYANDPRTATLLSENQWLGISQQDSPAFGTFDDYQYQPPSEDVRTLLFDPVYKGGLGVYRPEFFNRWAFPRLNCAQAWSGGGSVGGCYWNTGSPAPEQVAGRRQVASVTLRAAQASRENPRQTAVDVQLSVHNNGTLTAHTVNISSITLRTLAGAGQAAIISPVVPIRIDNLQPGATATIALKLSVPTTVTRLSLTEQGTIATGNPARPTVSRFSEGQSIILR